VRPLASMCMALSLAASCEKAPPEPPGPATLPVRVAPSANALAAPAGAARCVRPTPSSPPPPPPPGPNPACPRDPAGGPPMVPVGHLDFAESTDAPKLEVELMRTEPQQERGLMYRKSLADDRGMLFIWDRPSVHTFWMRNTCLPLDMLFIDDQGYIAGIVENVPTLNDDSRSIDCPVNYVLEVNAGWSRRHGVKAGQRVKMDGV
jgi:uncharacterized membrane protein (UPF0127 family)